MIKTLHKNKSLPKILLLNETHLNDSKIRHINIPNYNISYRNRPNKLGGGVAILTHKTLIYKNRLDLADLNKDNFECVFIELTQKAKKSIIIGSIYRPPNTKPRDFTTQYQHMLNRLKLEKKDIVLGMDHNLDLLKSNVHTETQTFLDVNFDNHLFPCITRPTRITKTSATLIDNTFISENLHKSFDSCVLTHDVSDHLPSLINIHNQIKNTSDYLEFESRSLTKEKISDIKTYLYNSNWSALNRNNVNIAFKDFTNIINTALDQIAPIKTTRIPCHKIWQEPWLTSGIIRSMNKSLKLYKKSIKHTATLKDIEKYKTYRNALTKIKRKAKEDYYIKQCYSLKSNTKKLWQLINHIISKTHDKTNIISSIKVDNIEYHDSKNIANCFGKYYSSIGHTLAKSINNNNHNKLSPQHFLSKISPNPHTMYFQPITNIEIKNFIKKLPSKNSSGHDNISNILLKKISECHHKTSKSHFQFITIQW